MSHLVSTGFDPQHAGERPSTPAHADRSVSKRRASGVAGDRSSFDAVDLYLSQLGRRPLLTREGEVELARRIEEGERAILRALAGSPSALRELAAVGAALGRKELRPRDVLRDGGNEELAGDRTGTGLIATLERAGMLAGAIEQGAAPAAKVRSAIAALEGLRLHRRVLDRAVEATRTALSEGRESPGRTMAAIHKGHRMSAAAKAELIESNLRLVVLFAKRHRNQGLPLLDLIQEGNIGLMRAADKFDHRRGIRFSTYAAWWVKQQMARAIADQGKTIRVPVHMVETRRKLTRARREFAAEHGREPDEQELVEQTGLLRGKVHAVSEIVPEPISLQAASGADREATVGDFIADRNAVPPDEIMARSRMQAQTRALLDVLTPREQAVLRMRFGLDGTEEHTLQEIGTSMSLSRERVRQIEAAALRKLRAPSIEGELETYLAA
jgi:RNA polymerase primary sigma factor